jgi:phosphopantetheine adenylyltransferase
MFLKQHIIKDIENIENTQLLNQVYEYLQIVKQSEKQLQPNINSVLKFAGLITNTQAKKISSTIQKEFNQIEGEW